jgi:hypothetical protein
VSSNVLVERSRNEHSFKLKAEGLKAEGQGEIKIYKQLSGVEDSIY